MVRDGVRKNSLQNEKTPLQGDAAGFCMQDVPTGKKYLNDPFLSEPHSPSGLVLS